MIFEFGKYKVDVDVEKTKSFYKSISIVGKGCLCDGCQNYEKAVDILSESVKDFFNNLGIDMKKVCECYVNCTNLDGSLFYGGFYHVCGVLLEGKSAWQKSNEKILFWDDETTFSVSDNFRVSFSNDFALLEEGFPLPVVQLDFEANIPWVLNKDNTYPKANR